MDTENNLDAVIIAGLKNMTIEMEKIIDSIIKWKTTSSAEDLSLKYPLYI